MLAAVIALTCATGLGSLWRMDLQPIETVDVTGARHVSRDNVLSLTGLLGAPVFRASAADARAILLAVPALRDASVELSLPGSARVSLSEREAVGRWMTGDLEWFVDEAGTLFASVDRTAAPDLRVTDARGPRSAGERIDPALVAAAIRLAKIAPRELRPDAVAPAVRVDPGPHGLVLDTGGGWEVRFGSPERIEEKLALLLRFLRDEPDRRLEYVDVRSTERIVFCPDSTSFCPE